MDNHRTRRSIMISPTRSPPKARADKTMTTESPKVLINSITDAWEQLNNLWDMVSMDNRSRELRTKAAQEILKNIINDILDGEKEMVAGVKSDINAALELNNSIREEMGEPKFNEKTFKPNSVNMLKALRKDLDRLRLLKSDRMKDQLAYYDELTSICERLDEEVPCFEGVEDKVLPKTIVKQILSVKEEKKQLLEKRLAEILELQDKANRMNTVVRNVTLDEFERDLLHLNFSNSGMPASQKYIESFILLVQKFDDEYKKWLDKVEFEYMELYAQISDLSNKCYTPEILDSYQPDFNPQFHNDREINRMKSDLAKLQKRYEEGAEIFDKFAEWQQAYDKIQDLAELMQTDAFRKNRGGCLNRALKEEKIFKTAMNERLEELRLLCEDNPITFDDLTVYEFALHKINKKEVEKENEKMMKKHTRQEQLKMEQRYGTKFNSKHTLSSPSKRTPQHTTTLRPAMSAQIRPQRTPLALNPDFTRKRLQTPQTEGILTKRRRSSSLSCIQPATPSNFRGPITSSPNIFDQREIHAPQRTPRRRIPVPKKY